MKPRRFIRVGVSNPEEYERVVITTKVTCDYYLKIKGQEPELLDSVRQWDLIAHLLRNHPNLIERRNLREETTVVYVKKRIK